MIEMLLKLKLFNGLSVNPCEPPIPQIRPTNPFNMHNADYFHPHVRTVSSYQNIFNYASLAYFQCSS